MTPSAIRTVYFGVFGTRGMPHGGHRFWCHATSDERVIREALPRQWVERIESLPPMREMYDRRPIEVSEPEGACAVHRLDGWTALAMWDRSVDMRGNCLSVFFVRGDLSFTSALAVAREAFPMVFARFSFPVVPAESPARTCSFCGTPQSAAVVAVRTRAMMCSTCLRRAARIVGMTDEQGAHEARVERLVAMIGGAA